MPNSTSIARGIAAATTCLLAAGVVAAAPAGAATHHRATTYLHATRHHTVVAPASIRPGIARLHNNGKHALLIIGGKSGAGAYQLARDLSAGSKTPSRLAKDFVVRDFLAAHQTVYLPLRRGTLYVAAASGTHVTTAAIRTVRVTGHVSNAVVPASRPVTIAADNSLHAAVTVPYRGTLHVMNHSGHLQEIILARISSSTPQMSLDTFAAHPTLKGLFRLRITSFAVAGILAGHHGIWTGLTGSRGHYAVISVAFTSHHTNPFRSAGVQLLAVT